MSGAAPHLVKGRASEIQMTSAGCLAYTWLVKHFCVLCVAAFVASASSASADRHAKPSAPVTVTLESHRVAGGFAVTITAAPTRAVPAISLSLASEHLGFGSTAAGQQRSLTVKVPVAPGAGADIIGSATVNVHGGIRNKAIVHHVGSVKPVTAKPGVVRTLPDGRAIQEVR